MAKKKSSAKEPESKEEDRLTSSDKIIIVGFILLVLAILAVVMAVNKMRTDEKNAPLPEPEYPERMFGDYVFELRDDNFWYTEVMIPGRAIYELTFYYHPEDTKNISIRKNIPMIFGNVSTVYFTLDPDLPSSAVIAGTEVSKILGRVFGKKVIAGLTRDVGNPAPVVTCDNISEGARVIKLDLTNRTNIDIVNGCLIIEGETPDELIRAADRMSYEFLGIMEAGKPIAMTQK